MYVMKKECSHCKKTVDWKQQILEWIKEHGDMWQEEALVMIMCYECGNYAGSISLFEGEYETEEVKSPALKEKISVPVKKKK